MLCCFVEEPRERKSELHPSIVHHGASTCCRTRLKYPQLTRVGLSFYPRLELHSSCKHCCDRHGVLKPRLYTFVSVNRIQWYLLCVLRLCPQFTGPNTTDKLHLHMSIYGYTILGVIIIWASSHRPPRPPHFPSSALVHQILLAHLELSDRTPHSCCPP